MHMGQTCAVLANSASVLHTLLMAACDWLCLEWDSHGVCGVGLAAIARKLATVMVSRTCVCASNAHGTWNK
jgi:hypothetical protein